MSSTAPQLRRWAPHLAQAAVRRARLSVVPKPRPTAPAAPRVPFVALVSLVLLAGVIGLLLFNTSMQQAAIRATALEAQATDLGARQEALELELATLRDRQRVAAQAQKLGMVIPGGTAGIVDLGTGKVSGHPVPATAGERVPVTAPDPHRKPQDQGRTDQAQGGAPNQDRAGDRGRNDG